MTVIEQTPLAEWQQQPDGSWVPVRNPDSATKTAAKSGGSGQPGPAGPAGPPGPPGTPGESWWTGAGAPAAGLGVTNDLYLNTTNGDVYDKASGAWVLVGNIRGPQGAQGPQGVQGVQGAQGVPGTAGATGATGPAGPAGSAGAPGLTGGLTIFYQMNAATSGVPASGTVRVNNTDLGQVTRLYLANVDRFGGDAIPMFNLLQVGTEVRLFRESAPSAQYVLGQITALTASAGYINITVLWQGGLGANTASADWSFAFALQGATGPTGPTGPAGSDPDSGWVSGSTVWVSSSAYTESAGSRARKIGNYVHLELAMTRTGSGSVTAAADGSMSTLFGTLTPAWSPTGAVRATWYVTRSSGTFTIASNGAMTGINAWPGAIIANAGSVFLMAEYYVD